MSCITLLSDFGLTDASVAVAKGVIMQHTTLPIVDISHEVKPYHLRHAAYLLGTAWKRFPPGTIHIPLYDLFSSPAPVLVLSTHRGHHFLGPDNGLITMSLGITPQSWLVAGITGKDTFTQWLQQAATVAHTLKSQPPHDLGLPAYTLENVPLMPQLATTSGILDCEVIHIDHYENVVINVTRSQFTELGAGRSFRLQFMMVEEIDQLSDTYTDVRPGMKLCRFNSNGYLEICINRGKAASLFGLRAGSKLNNIKLIFE